VTQQAHLDPKKEREKKRKNHLDTKQITFSFSTYSICTFGQLQCIKVWFDILPLKQSTITDKMLKNRTPTWNHILPRVFPASAWEQCISCTT